MGTGKPVLLWGLTTRGALVARVGLLSRYGTAGFRPLSPSIERHPPVNEILLEIRNEFQSYPQKSGELFALGQKILSKYNLSGMSVTARGVVDIFRSHDAARMDYTRFLEVERSARETTADPRRPVRSSDRYYYQTHLIQVLKAPETLEELRVLLVFEKIYYRA